MREKRIYFWDRKIQIWSSKSNRIENGLSVWILVFFQTIMTTEYCYQVLFVLLVYIIWCERYTSEWSISWAQYRLLSPLSNRGASTRAFSRKGVSPRFVPYFTVFICYSLWPDSVLFLDCRLNSIVVRYALRIRLYDTRRKYKYTWYEREESKGSDTSSDKVLVAGGQEPRCSAYPSILKDTNCNKLM